MGEVSEKEPPPILLLPGLLGNSKNFHSLAMDLSRRFPKRKIYSLDLMNHGPFSRCSHSWSTAPIPSSSDDQGSGLSSDVVMNYSAISNDILAFLKYRGMRNCVLVGHSIGGKSAMALAINDKGLEEIGCTIQGVVVLDIAPVCYRSGDGSGWEGINDVVGVMDGVEFEDICEDARLGRKEVDRMVFDGGIKDVGLRNFVLTNLVCGEGGWRWRVNILGIKRDLEYLAGFDYGCGFRNSESTASNPPLTLPTSPTNPPNRPPNKPQYLGPTYFISGGNSKYIKISHIPKINEYFPNHAISTIRGCGHWIHSEAESEVFRLICKFLTGEG